MSQHTPQLTPTQANIAKTAHHRLTTHHCAMIATPTGSGKTYIACDIIQRMLCDPITPNIAVIVVAPAHLREMWLRVAASFQLNIQFASYQMLSLAKVDFDGYRPILWIFDEAHALKNPSTKRFHFAQQYTAYHYICLMTATPVTMSWNDIYALVQLCGYPSAQKYFDKYMIQQFARAICIDDQIPQTTSETRICRHSYANSIVPNPQTLADIVDTLLSIQIYIYDSDDVIREAPILSHVLMHRLLSHPTSCKLTLERLMHYYKNAQIHGNRFLSKREFYSLLGASGRQLLLPFDDMIYGRKLDDDSKYAVNQTLQSMKRAHLLLSQLGDDIAIRNIQNIINAIPINDSVILFTQYADTARYYADRLKLNRPLALLTARVARYGKSTCKRELVETAFDASCPLHDFYTISNISPPKVVICSDAFSSGHNLQRANHLIHLDMPWNPATQIQREGRLLRIGQSAKSVHFYTPSYPKNISSFSTFANAIDQRLKSRRRLLQTWHSQWLPPTFDAAIRISTDRFPNHWARFAGQWIPIAPNHSIFQPSSHSHNSHRQTTFGRIHHTSLAAVKKSLSPLWKALKREYAYDEVAQSLFFDFIGRACLFPRLTRTLATSPSPSAAIIARQMPIIRTVFWLPPPSTPCELFTVYPQENHDLPTDSQK